MRGCTPRERPATRVEPRLRPTRLPGRRGPCPLPGTGPELACGVQGTASPVCGPARALAQHCARTGRAHAPSASHTCLRGPVRTGRALVDGGPHKEQPPSPETLQLLGSVSPPEIGGQAPHRWELRDQAQGGDGQAARARDGGPVWDGRAGTQGRAPGGRGGLARVGRLRAGIPSGQSGLFSPLRKVVAVAGSESPGLLTGLVLGGGREGQRAEGPARRVHPPQQTVCSRRVRGLGLATACPHGDLTRQVVHLLCSGDVIVLTPRRPQVGERRRRPPGESGPLGALRPGWGFSSPLCVPGRVSVCMHAHVCASVRVLPPPEMLPLDTGPGTVAAGAGLPWAPRSAKPGLAVGTAGSGKGVAVCCA